MELTLIERSDEFALTVDDIKPELGITLANTDHDTRLENLIAEATSFLEEHMDRTILETTWELTTNCLPHRIYIPKPPLLSVEWIKYYDQSNQLQTLATEYYSVLKPYNTSGFVQRRHDFRLDSYLYRPDAVQIRFKTGYEPVPANIKRTLKVICGWLDKDREGFMDWKANGLDRLLWNVSHVTL